MIIVEESVFFKRKNLLLLENFKVFSTKNTLA